MEAREESLGYLSWLKTSEDTPTNERYQAILDKGLMSSGLLIQDTGLSGYDKSNLLWDHVVFEQGKLEYPRSLREEFFSTGGGSRSYYLTKRGEGALDRLASSRLTEGSTEMMEVLSRAQTGLLNIKGLIGNYPPNVRKVYLDAFLKAKRLGYIE